ncbi:MAG: helix-turn-helix domain-containing protein [Hydrococcus sp. C42_A2020_068]|uniref:helix-turn-helix domain-containing protein n=1 Tax=Pleurocapsa sp. PCC 7327 TaxID=118163 RepID=UPI00029F80EA|nr:helix-turn-helix domain-containing protein [Pleurocapsa sp. PCC 7327]AFY75545.1 putative transcription factor, MBF1 like protein [Pleurocapsa sp. PCC 7327]MBF2022037.1 helix-turn-helix domain-containing protein [Hydrococcus sp. C42_A2020_068]
MTYTIVTECIACDACRPRCPTEAIARRENLYQIDPYLCNNCLEYYPDPLCVVLCPTLHPVPLEIDPSFKIKRKKCRWSDKESLANPELFLDGKTTAIAAARIVWEACNLLAQSSLLPWLTEPDGKVSYSQQFRYGKGKIRFRLAENLEGECPNSLSGDAAWRAIELFNLRAACMHLIYAACATTLERPWEEAFVIDDGQIEAYLRLDERKDLSRHDKLALIKFLARQPCQLLASIRFPQQERLRAFTVEESRLWHLLSIEHRFQEDSFGNKHVIGLRFRIRAGQWAKYFLNPQGAQEKTAFYQSAILPKSLLEKVMSLWQKHQGAARMMLWLLFKLQQEPEEAIAVSTLMKVGYGEEPIARTNRKRDRRTQRIQTFENDLEVLYECGFKPVFDPVTYASEIQPLWAKLLDIPEDSEADLDFWIDDASKSRRITDPAPRRKWERLMNAYILKFELPTEFARGIAEFEAQKKETVTEKAKRKIQPELTGEAVIAARNNKGWSQRRLAKMMGKSQSWVRDIEHKRFEIKPADRERLREILGL